MVGGIYPGGAYFGGSPSSGAAVVVIGVGIGRYRITFRNNQRASFASDQRATWRNNQRARFNEGGR